MTAKLLEGAPLAEKINTEIRTEAEAFKAAHGRSPKLVAVQVGESSAGTRGYAKSQSRGAEAVGIDHEILELPGDITEQALIARVAELSTDETVDGILLFVPMPEHIDPRNVQVGISPEKDVEGMHPENLGRLFYGNQIVAPCTAMSAVELLRSSGVDLAGKEVVVLGHSEIVGKPVAMLLLQSLNESPTVTVAHVATSGAGMRDFHTKRADVVISAMGYKPQIITADLLKEGAIVVDVATMQIPKLDEDGQPVLNKKGKPKKRWVGDVDFEGAVEKCSYISPVPGGVGPLTVTILMRNLVRCAAAAR
jgi:methylenetetrahydrofolate dehydrogenase (NADP+)/methenyltetrahydrofolate cyclohydrolase